MVVVLHPPFFRQASRSLDRVSSADNIPGNPLFVYQVSDLRSQSLRQKWCDGHLASSLQVGDTHFGADASARCASPCRLRMALILSIV
jgi:hypothetical protein